jgi:hypothetical protein
VHSRCLIDRFLCFKPQFRFISYYFISFILFDLIILAAAQQLIIRRKQNHRDAAGPLWRCLGQSSEQGSRVAGYQAGYLACTSTYTESMRDQALLGMLLVITKLPQNLSLVFLRSQTVFLLIFGKFNWVL